MVGEDLGGLVVVAVGIFGRRVSFCSLRGICVGAFCAHALFLLCVPRRPHADIQGNYLPYSVV